MTELQYITAPILGGIIGYLTNDIAIRMLFRPHTEKYIFGVHIPFTPGIIPKEKGRIAVSLGSAVSENLMNRDVLEKYLLADEMIGKIRESITAFIDKQKSSNESVKVFICHYLSVEEVQVIASSITENISRKTYTKLVDPVIGDTVAKVVIEHVSKSLSGDEIKIFLAGIGGFAKGIGGITSNLFGVDVVGKFLSLLREPSERFLAHNINTVLVENGEDIVNNIFGNELSTFLDKPIASVIADHEEQLTQFLHFLESIYRTIITEHLPRILESIDISRIVSERINEMDMDETENLIFQVMNKELKSIVWFGAGLGFFMGVLSCVVS